MDGAVLVRVLGPADRAIGRRAVGGVGVREVHPVEANAARADKACAPGGNVLDGAAGTRATVTGHRKAAGRSRIIHNDAVSCAVTSDATERQSARANS